jgi:hypothetical protein
MSLVTFLVRQCALENTYCHKSSHYGCRKAGIDLTCCLHTLISQTCPKCGYKPEINQNFCLDNRYKRCPALSLSHRFYWLHHHKQPEQKRQVFELWKRKWIKRVSLWRKKNKMAIYNQHSVFSLEDISIIHKESKIMDHKCWVY